MSSSKKTKLEVLWDMETGDPDDFFTLLFLLGHPLVHLKAVTITPGTPEQVGLVRKALSWFERDIPVGAFSLQHQKSCVSTWYSEIYGSITPSQEATPAYQVLLENLTSETTLITGAPLKNLGALIQYTQQHKIPFFLPRLVVQGGFAGEGIVPRPLEKFKGRRTCPSYNLNGDPHSALLALKCQQIALRRFVSKNVCHGVFYDKTLHEAVGAIKSKSLSLSLIWKGMEAYLKKHPEGKKFHDPLAACCAIDESIGTWVEVELFREKGEWGAKKASGTNTWIIIEYSHKKFLQTFLAQDTV
jgi:inosine-uridine nucleoside N-ribohydrolase